MDGNHIDKIVEDTLQSFEGVERAEPKPFLLPRVLASVNKQSSIQNTWTKIGSFISRPGIAVAGMLLVILVNTAIFFAGSNNADKAVIGQSNSTTDEFAINAVNIYEFENIEP